MPGINFDGWNRDIIELWWVMLMVSNGSTIFTHTLTNIQPVIIDIWWMINGASCRMQNQFHAFQSAFIHPCHTFIIRIFLTKISNWCHSHLKLASNAFKEFQLFSNLSYGYWNFHLLPFQISKSFGFFSSMSFRCFNSILL